MDNIDYITRLNLLQDVTDILIQRLEVSGPFKDELEALIAKHRVLEYEMKDGARVYKPVKLKSNEQTSNPNSEIQHEASPH